RAGTGRRPGRSVRWRARRGRSGRWRGPKGKMLRLLFSLMMFLGRWLAIPGGLLAKLGWQRHAAVYHLVGLVGLGLHPGDPVAQGPGQLLLLDIPEQLPAGGRLLRVLPRVVLR